VVWTDPTTGESFIVDTGTGNSKRASGPEEGGVTTPRRTLAARGHGDAKRDEVPSWIGEALTVCFNRGRRDS